MFIKTPALNLIRQSAHFHRSYGYVEWAGVITTTRSKLSAEALNSRM